MPCTVAVTLRLSAEDVKFVVVEVMSFLSGSYALRILLQNVRRLVPLTKILRELILTTLVHLAGKFYSPQQFIDYKADVEKPLPMIYQSGYLTIKGVRRIGMRNIYKLDFPNAEVAEGFLTLVANNYLQSREDSNSWLYETAEALENGDLSTFERALTAFLASIPYTARRHENEREKERYFQYTVYLLMRMVGCYTVYHEKETSAGRADCVVETPGYETADPVCPVLSGAQISAGRAAGLFSTERNNL